MSAAKEKRDKSGNSSPLSAQERKDVRDHHSLSSVSVYAVVHREGMEELNRPATSLWWSGVAAGVGISTSVMAEGILHKLFEGSPHQFAIENLGYTVGFVLVILGRLQLFTENTITAILPLLTHRSLNMLWSTLRIWAIVFIANLCGTFLAASLGYFVGTVPPEFVDGMAAVSHHYANLELSQAFSLGITSGFLVAAIVWMIPSARGAAFLVIIMFTYLIAIGNFTHVIAGSTELFLLTMRGEVGLTQTAALLVCTLLGNIAGGTGLFALLAYGQVVRELE
ncbi:formate/nitrite transporter family protein [uncultured Cohaesibacter sp.]|uniref:formate/nitrite transporter family protein n=1 Tax=uncultured Cohaesibacter sp. TaxID=1002546 RepID=UPI002AAB9140|nr:formate/nitrite transporter family protein [uncultured Cohaesibacter sp.]